MRKIYKLFFVVTTLLLTIAVKAQNNYFRFEGENARPVTTGKREVVPTKYGAFSTDISLLRSFLWTLPSEKQLTANRSNAPVMQLPMPDGKVARFRVWESSLMEPGLAAKFPEMRQFLGQGIDDPYATVRLDYNPFTGIHAQVLSAATGRIFIDPYATGDLSNYISYYARDYANRQNFTCSVEDIDYPSSTANRTEALCLGTTLRTYRLALACTGEYAVAVNGPTPTVPGVAAAMLTAVNRVTGVYENEVSVRLQLVANNDLLIYLDGTTDPYTNNNGGTMLGQNQTTCDNIIGSANYDIGHVFSTGGGGVAGLGVICVNGNKARGVTGLPNPVGDAFYIDYVAHEMGHQFGGNHTFNSVTSSCGGGNRNGSTAYEVGSGTTIQAYAGICGTDNIQPNSDPFFHAVSFDEISNRVNATSCAATSATGNTLPVIDALPNNGVTIPISTPFTLSGSATDANGDALTYCWEQWDLGAGGAWNGGATAAANNTLPLFKSRVPKTTGDRTFPDIAVILAGYPANPAATMGGLKGETLSPVARAMNFRLTVRDNRAGGGGTVSAGSGGCQSSTPFVVNVAGTAPFVVTAPNGGESYAGGSTQTVTWNVVGTNAAPFNVSNVRILFSSDGGLTFPTVLLASTANDGSEAVTIPVGLTSTARIKVEALGNIFFDISDNNFSVTAPVNGFTFNSPAAVVAACPAPNTMTSGNLTATYVGSFTGNINLSGTVSPAGPAVSFSNNPLTTGSPSTTVSLTGMAALAPGNYTVTVTGVGVGGPTVTRDIVFTINPGSGPAITTQPANQTACVGQNATFTVAATGVTGYQWQVSTTGCAGTFTNIAGATSASYTVSSATIGQNGNAYRCVLTGQCGTSTSSCVTLTVNAAPAITGQPSNISVCSGSAASFTVTATGAGIGYQWEVSTDGGTTWNPIAGATSATYTIASTTTGQNNNRYRCVVTGTCTPAATSSAAILTVSSSVTITSNPSNVTLCEGTNTSFTVAAGGSGLSYQWEISTNGGTTWANVTNGGVYGGATTATLTLTNVPPTFNTYRYRCTVSSPPCTPATSTAAILTVNTFPVITVQPSNVTICEFGNPTFSVTATTGVGSLTYQWQISTNGGASWTNIAGATSSSYAQTNVPAGQNGYRFRVIVTAGCGSTTSNAGILTVNTYPVFNLTNIPVTLCLSDPAYALTASLAGGAWSGPGVSGSNFVPSAAGLGTKTVSYSVTNAGCVTTKSAPVNVNECAERHRLLDAFQAVFVYPNPSNGIVNMRLNTDLYNSLGLRIFNAMGQEVKSELFTGLGYGSVVSTDLSRLPAGTYQLYMYNTQNGFIKKAVSVIYYKR